MPYTFHDHSAGDPCAEASCWTLPDEATVPRLKRLPHTHIAQVTNGVPGCSACENIRPDRVAGPVHREPYAWN